MTKKILLAMFLSLFVASVPNVFAAAVIDRGFVFSENRHYEASFGLTDTYDMRAPAWARSVPPQVSDKNFDVYMQNVPGSSGDLKLAYNPNYDLIYQYLFTRGFSTGGGYPSPGAVWEITYTFYVDEDRDGVLDLSEPTAAWTIPTGSIRQMGVVQNVSISGGTYPVISWDPVPNAEYYRVRLFSIESGVPATLLYQSQNFAAGLASYQFRYTGNLFQQCQTLAIVIEAWETNQGIGLLNRSRYYAQYPGAGAPTSDATGTWTYSTSANWVDPGNFGCPPQQDEFDTATVTQTGQNVTLVTGDGDTFTGCVTGPDYNLSASLPQQGGTAIVNLDFDLSAVTAGTGTTTWSWTYGNFYCNGGALLSMNICLGKPTLQTPIGPQPTYQWSVNGVGWTYYWVYVQNLSTGATSGSGWVASFANTWDQPAPLPWGNYRAWVQVYHPQCGVSGWSDPQDFTVGNCASKPTLTVSQTAPASDEQPRYQWNAGANAQWAYYWVYVVNSSTGQVYDSGWVNSPDNFWDQLVQLPWGNYQAFVQVYHPQCGVSGWSDPVNFTVGNCASKPTLTVSQTAPASDEQPRYQWDAGANAQWTYYWVYVVNSSTGQVYDSGWVNSTDNFWDQLSQLPWGNYQAFVQVYHTDCGVSGWSDPVNFTVGNCANKPVLQSVSGSQPTYQWGAGANAQWTYYWVYVLNLSTGQVYDSGWVNSTDNFWDQPALLPSGNYQAWVQVYHPNCGVSGWSDPQGWIVP
jgi:hypothetical protein